MVAGFKPQISEFSPSIYLKPSFNNSQEDNLIKTLLANTCPQWLQLFLSFWSFQRLVSSAKNNKS
jgi:hypothetical protein